MKRDTAANALRRGRFSAPAATYFVTLCVEPRRPVLVSTIAENALRALQENESAGAWRLRCATIMPDHVHAVFDLGFRLTLPQAIARYKAATRGLLGAVETRWQANFYDHRLRPHDSVEDTFRYVWCNPQAAGLAAADETWPYAFVCQEDWRWFEPRTRAGFVFAEWLR